EAENPAYPPIVLQDGQELQIFGVVTSCIHPVK
ncbi:partial DNA polymerase V, partial [Anaerolineae bacterium]